ncbi:MAG: hypothetical protein RPU34_04090 [Candidatus Sedimenticola sp. (ex Thyasira tokunagai)]
MSKISTASRNAQCDAHTALLDGGTVEFRTGVAPADPQTADSGTLLATVTLAATAFAAAVNGSAALNTTASTGTVGSDNDVGHARWKDSGGTAVMDCSVAVSSADMLVDSISWTTGQIVDITSFSYTVPEASA